MGDFSIKAIFKAIDRFSAPVDRMMRKTGSFAKSANKNLAKVNRGFNFLTGGIAQKVDRALIGGVVAATGVAVIGLKQAIDEGARFESTLVAAGQKFPETIAKGTEEFGKLKAAAMDIGETTEFTAEQAAGGLKFMAMAGEDAATSMRSLGTMTDLATAQGLDLDRAMDISSDALGVLGAGLVDTGDKVKNYTILNDKMAFAANASNQNIEQLFEATTAGGSGFIAFGQNADTFLAATDVLAAAGTKGGKAGTDLQRIMARLSASTGPAAKALRKIRFKPFIKKDGQKVLKSFDVMLEEIIEKTKKMTKDQRAVFLKPIVGDRGIDTMSKLLDAGPEQLRKYRKGIEEAGGTSERLAKAQRDTTAGRLKALESMIQSFKLGVFDIIKDDLDDALTEMYKLGPAVKEAFGKDLKEGIVFVKGNIQDIAKWGKRLGITVAAFWAMSKAIKAVQITMTLLEGATWAYKIATTSAIPAARRLLGFLGDIPAVAKPAGTAMSALRAPITDLKSPTQRLGGAVAATAAAWAGWKFGGWINETFAADERIADLMETVTGLDAEIDRINAKAGRRKFATNLDELISQAKSELVEEEKASEDLSGFWGTLTGQRGESLIEQRRLISRISQLEKKKLAGIAGEEVAGEIFTGPDLPSAADQKAPSIWDKVGTDIMGQLNETADAVGSKTDPQGRRAQAEFYTTETLAQLPFFMEPISREEAMPAPMPIEQGATASPAAAKEERDAELLAEVKKMNARKDSLEITLNDDSKKAEVTGGTLKNTVKVQRTGAL